MSQVGIARTQVAADWYRRFFGDLALRFWQGLMPPELTEAEADFLWATLRLKPGDRVLDAPCGAGRHARALAQRQAQVLALDVSDVWLAEGRRQAEANITWILADMACLAAALPAETLLDGGFCWGNSFGYLPREGMRRMIGELGERLRPGARFAVDTGMVAEAFLPNIDPQIEMTVDGVRMLAENVDYDPLESQVISRFEWSLVDPKADPKYGSGAGARRETALVRHTIFTVAELVELFAQAGCRPVGLYSDLVQTPFQIADARLIAVFEKT